MSVLDDALDLLERERAMLLSGRLKDLQRLVSEKERVSERLRRVPLKSPNEARRLRSAADRNQRLITSAKRGLSEAIEQIRTAREPRSLTTYAADGEKSSETRNGENLRKFV